MAQETKRFYGITGTVVKHTFDRACRRVTEFIQYELYRVPYECTVEWDWGESPDTSRFHEMKGQPVRFMSTIHEKSGRQITWDLFNRRA